MRRAPRSARTRSPGSDDPGQVQRIGGADDEAPAVCRRAPDLAQPLDRAGKRELFARHAGHEPSAADLAPRLEAAIHAGQLAPGRDVRFAGQQPPEDDAVALKQRPRLEFDGGLSIAALKPRAILDGVLVL